MTDTTQGDNDRASQKAQRQAERAARTPEEKAARKAARQAMSPEERQAAKAARKAERKARREGDGGDAASPFG